MTTVQDLLNDHEMSLLRRNAEQQIAALQQSHAQAYQQSMEDIASWQALLFAVQKQLERYEPEHPLLKDKDLRRRIGDAGITAYRLAPKGAGFDAAREAGASFKIQGVPVVNSPYSEIKEEYKEALTQLFSHQGELQRISLAKQLSPKFLSEFQAAMGLIDQRILRGEVYSDPQYNTLSLTTTWEGLPAERMPSEALRERGRQNYMRWWGSRGGYLKPVDPTESQVKSTSKAPVKIPLGPNARAITTANEDNAELLKQVSGGVARPGFGPNAAAALAKDRAANPSG